MIDRMLTFSGLLLWVLVIGGVAGAYAGEPEVETEAKSDWQRGYDLGFSHGAEIMQTFADNVDECLHAGTICCTDFIRQLQHASTRKGPGPCWGGRPLSEEPVR